MRGVRPMCGLASPGLAGGDCLVVVLWCLPSTLLYSPQISIMYNYNRELSNCAFILPISIKYQTLPNSFGAEIRSEKLALFWSYLKNLHPLIKEGRVLQQRDMKVCLNKGPKLIGYCEGTR